MSHCVRSSDAFNEFNNLTLSNEMSNYKFCYTRCKIIYERNDFMYHFNLTADIEVYGDVMIMNIGDTFRVTITRDAEAEQGALRPVRIPAGRREGRGVPGAAEAEPAGVPRAGGDRPGGGEGGGRWRR